MSSGSPFVASGIISVDEGTAGLGLPSSALRPCSASISVMIISGRSDTGVGSTSGRSGSRPSGVFVLSKFSLSISLWRGEMVGSTIGKPSMLAGSTGTAVAAFKSGRTEEHTSELQTQKRSSSSVSCLKQKTEEYTKRHKHQTHTTTT